MRNEQNNARISKEFQGKISWWRAKFKENLTEKSYKKYEKSKKSPSSFFVLSILILLGLLYFINYLVKTGSESKKTIIFQIILVLMSCAISGCMYLMKIKNKLEEWGFLINFLVFGLALIFNDYEFQKINFDQTEPLNLNCLPGLILLVFLFSVYFPVSFIDFLIGDLILLSIFGAVRIHENGGSEVLNLFILALSQVVQLSLIYKRSLKKRRKYYLGTNRVGTSSLNEDIRNSIKLCKENLIDMLNEIDPVSKEKIEQVLSLLTVLSDRNINSLDYNIDAITKGLDEDDRIYIQQSWTNFRVLNIRKQEKIKENIIEKNIEITENPDIVLILKQIGNNWNINSFELDLKSENHPVLQVGLHSFKLFNLITTFSITETKLVSFLKEIENKYKPNPYHNAIHAADILFSALYIINSTFIKSNLTDLEMVSIILSHVAHDVGHPGFNNRFLINIQDDLAIQYNDISILENMHSSITFNLLRNESLNFLDHFEPDQLSLIRKWTIEMILATDMGRHFDLLRVFKSHSYLKSQFESQDTRLEVLKILIKAADIGHSAKTNTIHKKWSGLISEEFFRQGDVEKEAGKPVSMYCDRETTIVPKSQIGFLKNIALPLYETLGLFLDSQLFNRNCIEQIRVNIQEWENEYGIGSYTTTRVEKVHSEISEKIPLQIHKSEKIISVINS